MKKLFIIFCTLTITAGCSSCNKKETGGDSEPKGGYLFSHMTTGDYGGMYYSVSEDGVRWETLNNGEKVSEYRGHHDFCLGRDGRYYMIGVDGGTRMPLLWSTSNLIGWGVEKQLPKSAFDVSESGFFTEDIWYNAPKMYFDKASDQYIITWHPANKQNENPANETESQNMWRSIRTFYILTRDFETFTKPQRLFNFTGKHENMPTMDAIIRKIDGKYYSFIKDERWEGETPEGFKAIRWTKSDNLTGPYENPSAAVTDTWTEAQTLVENPAGTGWHLYVEHYPLEYYLYTSPSIEGPWSRREITSPDARHGSIIKIDGETMQAVKKAFKNR